MKSKKILLFVSIAAAMALCCPGRSAAQDFSYNVFKIGNPDGSHSEFALSGKHYNGVQKHFPNLTSVYLVGKNKPADIPFVVPGPMDGWAGNQNGTILMRFGVKNVLPEAAHLRLAMDFIEVHPSGTPTLEICLNDYKVHVKAPAGHDQNYLDHGRTQSRGLNLYVNLPSEYLKKGDNTLKIRTLAGSWMVLDDIRLESTAPVATTVAREGIDLVSATSVPAMVYGKTKDEVLHPVSVEIVNWGTKAKKYEWTYDGGKSGGVITVSPGVNKLELGIPDGYDGKIIDVVLAAGKDVKKAEVKIVPADRWTIYLVQHTHTDIGYTKPQTEILSEHLRYIDYALEYCRATEHYPDESKFRWTCEASWAVKEWLRIRPQEQVENFLHYVKNGQIEVTAMFFNMSELSGENNYKTFLAPIAEFHELGIPVTTALQNDVNGIVWCLADYLPDVGVKYICIGSNGHRADIPFDRPTLFNWESPSGKSILTFRADHYHTGNSWGIDRGDMNSFERGVFSYITSMKHRGYRFPLIAVEYSGYLTDNSPPSMVECEVIRKWNERYAWPKVKSATSHEFLQEIDEHYSDQLPVYRAAYPDWWTDGFGSAARESAASRTTQSDMIAIESMLSMAELSGDEVSDKTHDELRRIHENLLFYDEHTFGASESIWDPMCENSQVQWAEKGSYAWEALKSAQMMYEAAAGRLQGNLYRSDKPTITFFNPLGTDRSAPVEVYIDFELIPDNKAFSIIDENGQALKVQPLRSRREGRYYKIWAENIPSLGYKTYEILVEDKPYTKPDGFKLADNVFQNQWYKAEFDRENGGIVSLVDLETGKELVDSKSEWNLGGFIYESLEGDRNQMERKVFEKFRRSGLTEVRYTGTTAGDVYNSVSYQGKAEGCDPGYGVRVEVKFYNHVKRIEISYAMKRLPETNPSGLYVAFPFLMDNAKLAFDVPGGVVYAGENQIPRTSTAWNTVQNYAAVRNADSQILVSCDEIPLFMMGELLNDPYRLVHKHENAHVFSWIMNNYWTTNFRAMQEGELKWTYAITSMSDNSDSSAAEFGWGNRVPLYARVMPAGITKHANSKVAASNRKARSYSFLSIEPSNVFMTSCEPSKAQEKAVLINLRETDGKEAILKVCGPDNLPLKFEIVNVLDEGDSKLMTDYKMKPYENIFIRIKR